MILGSLGKTCICDHQYSTVTHVREPLGASIHRHMIQCHEYRCNQHDMTVTRELEEQKDLSCSCTSDLQRATTLSNECGATFYLQWEIAITQKQCI
jgi:hypothetical protein